MEELRPARPATSRRRSSDRGGGGFPLPHASPGGALGRRAHCAQRSWGCASSGCLSALADATAPRWRSSPEGKDGDTKTAVKKRSRQGQSSRPGPRRCSVPSRPRRRLPPAPSASTPRAASPAPRRSPSTGRPGRPCACPATAIGAIPTDQAGREARRRGQGARRLARASWSATSPSRAAGPCYRPRQPSGRARCRRLVHADAGPPPDEQEREEISATSMLADDRVSVIPRCGPTPTSAS